MEAIARLPWLVTAMPRTSSGAAAGKLIFINVCSGQGSRVNRRITSGAKRAAVCQGIASPSMKCWLSAIAGMSSNVASIAAATVPE